MLGTACGHCEKCAWECSQLGDTSISQAILNKPTTPAPEPALVAMERALTTHIALVEELTASLAKLQARIVAVEARLGTGAEA